MYPIPLYHPFEGSALDRSFPKLGYPNIAPEYHDPHSRDPAKKVIQILGSPKP